MDALAELESIKRKMESLVAIEEEDKISIERRMGHLEKSIATQDVLLRRNTEILDEIRQHLNRPTNWAERVAAGTAVLLLAGGILYTAYIKPLDQRIDILGEKIIENAAYLRSIGDYSRETRGILDVHTANEEHISRHPDRKR